MKELSKWVKEACETKEATKQVVQSVLSKVKKASPEIIQKVLWAGVNALVYEYRHAKRNRMRGLATECARGFDGISVASGAAEEGRRKASITNLLDMIINGQRFGSMTGDEVLLLSEDAHREMLGLHINRDYFYEVGKKAGKKRVEQVFTNKKLNAIMNRVREQVAKIA